jgi:hypothetical protein
MKDFIKSLLRESLLQEGNQRDRNELASYIIDLNNEISSAKSRGKNKEVEYLTKDLEKAKADLAKLKSIKEGEDETMVVNSLDELKNEINKAGYNSEMCLIDECFNVIFKHKTPLEIVNNNRGYGSYLSHPDEIATAFHEKMKMIGNPVDLSIEKINKLIILFIIIENSESIEAIIKHIDNGSITIDTYMLYKYINLYDTEDGDILRKIDEKFVEEYKDLV